MQKEYTVYKEVGERDKMPTEKWAKSHYAGLGRPHSSLDFILMEKPGRDLKGEYHDHMCIWGNCSGFYVEMDGWID